MKKKLYDAIKNYCDENECWKAYNTAKDWNEILGTTYSPATFTAATKSGLLVRRKDYRDKSYEYRLAPREEELAEMAEIERKAAEREAERERKEAELYLENRDMKIEQDKAFYELLIKEANEKYLKAIKNAELYLERTMDYHAERLAEAEALLNMQK